MKRSNKALYEQIMMNVSKQVKRALNENQNDNVNPFGWITKLIVYNGSEHIGVRSGKEEQNNIVDLVFDQFKSPEKYLELDNDTIATYIKSAIQQGLETLNTQNEELDPEIQEIINLAKKYKPGEKEIKIEDLDESVSLYAGYDPDDFDIDYYETATVDAVSINVETNTIKVYLYYEYEGDGWYDIDELTYENSYDKVDLIGTIKDMLEELVDELDEE